MAATPPAVVTGLGKPKEISVRQNLHIQVFYILSRQPTEYAKIPDNPNATMSSLNHPMEIQEIMES